MVEMLHYNEICAALRGLLQGSVRLSADSDETDLVSVGSNRLFAPGQAVVLRDGEGQQEAHEVAERVGLTSVRLDSEVEGSFTVADGAVLALAEGALEEVKWIAQGAVELLPLPAETALPGIVLQPGVMEQPLTGGTNRAYQQNYRCRVFYLQRPLPGEAASVRLLENAAAVFNAIMQDPYLGGTAWYAQVTRVEPDPAEVRGLRERGVAVVGVELEVLAQRMEMGE